MHDRNELIARQEYRKLLVSDARCREALQQRRGHQHDPDPRLRQALVDSTQKRLAEASRAALEKSKPFRGEVVTGITKSSQFYPAEGYHQDFYKKNPAHYERYRIGCGRDRVLKVIWGGR